MAKGVKATLEEILVQNSTYSNTHRVKLKLIEACLLENKCSICSLGNEWNGKTISLQLDHINGVNNDNRLSNLRILCPNCHSQTETYSAKNTIGRIKSEPMPTCKKCSKVLTVRNNLNSLCRKCEDVSKRVVERPSREMLNTLIRENSFVEVGRMFSVSDNSIRKWCKSYGLPHRKKDL